MNREEPYEPTTKEDLYWVHAPEGAGDHVYDWRGHLVGVEYFTGPADISDILYPAAHPDGRIPDNETHAMIELLATNGRGWWMEAEEFRKEAKPINPSAIRLEEAAAKMD